MTREIIHLESLPDLLRKPARKLTLDEIKSERIQSLILEMKDILKQIFNKLDSKADKP